MYIGFGSIVVDDPDQFTKLIFEAIKKAGVRALVSKGWGGLGDEGSTPDNVYMLENTPHDWLFPRVSAVVHHGGAGTVGDFRATNPQWSNTDSENHYRRQSDLNAASLQ